MSPGTPFLPDLQAWIRNADLKPDWLRIRNRYHRRRDVQHGVARSRATPSPRPGRRDRQIATARPSPHWLSSLAGCGRLHPHWASPACRLSGGAAHFLRRRVVESRCVRAHAPRAPFVPSDLPSTCREQSRPRQVGGREGCASVSCGSHEHRVRFVSFAIGFLCDAGSLHHVKSAPRNACQAVTGWT